MENGSGGMTEVQLPVIKQTVHSAFQVAEPQPMEDGGMQVNFIGLDGHLQSWPLNEKQKTTLGRQLLAPRIHTDTRGLPPEVKKNLAKS